MIDLQIESQTLAAMIESHECLDMGIAALKADYFMDNFYRQVFRQIKDMYSESKPITAVIIYEIMKDACKNRGTTWLILKETYFNKESFKFYCQKLSDLYKTRQLVELAQKVIQRAESAEPVSNILKDLENELYAVNLDQDLENIISPHERASKMLETLGERMEKKTNGGIKTSYPKLNSALNGGFLPGQLVILAAKTGKGKTAFAMNLMRDVAITHKQPALYVNTEMNESQMDCRWMTMLTKDMKIDHSKIASGNIDSDELQKVMDSMNLMHNSGFYSITIPELTQETLISTARRFKAQTKMKFLVVDYIGRMDTTDSKLAEWQVYKQIAKRLKTLAQQLEITVVMLAQISEDEKLEGAKGMKNEADLFCYLREAKQDEFTNHNSNYCLAIDKNRDGRRGKIQLIFVGEKLTFLEG